MHRDSISLELLTEENFPLVRTICRKDIPEEYVDTVDNLMELTRYGNEHHCLGHTYVVNYEKKYIGILLLGEAIPWETDPKEMREVPFYRLMGFVLDQNFRGQGIGGAVLEMAVQQVYRDFGPRPISLGCHKDNRAAERFYLRHGFVKTQAMEGNDYYFFRYPIPETSSEKNS